jgi:hypothetical protein
VGKQGLGGGLTVRKENVLIKKGQSRSKDEEKKIKGWGKGTKK